MLDYRDHILELVEEGQLDSLAALTMALCFMPQVDISEMIRVNDLPGLELVSRE